MPGKNVPTGKAERLEYSVAELIDDVYRQDYEVLDDYNPETDITVNQLASKYGLSKEIARQRIWKMGEKEGWKTVYVHKNRRRVLALRKCG